MRRVLLGLLLAGLSLPLMAAVQDSYYVVLRDGAWVRAADKPTVEDGVAKIRLPNGMLAEIDAERIDWRSSDSKSRQMQTVALFGSMSTPSQNQPMVRGEIPGTLTIVNAPSEAASGAVAAPGSGPAEAAPTMPTDPSASLRGRINTLDSGIAELQERRRDLLQRAHASYNLDEAAKMRTDAEGIERQIQTLRDEKERLLKQLWNVQQP